MANIVTALVIGVAAFLGITGLESFSTMGVFSSSSTVFTVLCAVIGSIASLILTIISIYLWLSFSYTEDNWMEKGTNLILVYLTLQVSIFAAGISLIPTGEESVLIWIAIISIIASSLARISVLINIFIYGIWIYMNIDNVREDLGSKQAVSLSSDDSYFGNDPYRYEIQMEICSYHHTTEKEYNSFDNREACINAHQYKDPIYATYPDMSIGEISIGLLKVSEEYLFRKNMPSGGSYYFKNNDDIYNNHIHIYISKIYTSDNVIPIMFDAYDKDGVSTLNLDDTDGTPDYIDISKDPNQNIAYLLYDIENDKIYYDTNQNYKIDIEDIEGEKVCDNRFKVESDDITPESGCFVIEFDIIDNGE